ncbi:WD repeat-containing protein 3-like [Zophobas morio]|uniref:WD repeat-containing protein 3-like n=1 Tax=Zophobas morio TaxID=2755281 RepID=UPI0030832E83
MEFDTDEILLVSGSKDTDLIVWDVVSETGLYRLKGHKDEITRVFIINSLKYVISSSKDTTIKFWDLDLQSCVHTIASHRSEVTSFVVNPQLSKLITASTDEVLKIWKIRKIEDSTDVLKREAETSSLCKLEIIFHGEVKRKENGRVMSLTLHNDRVLIVQGQRKTIEFFVLATEVEIKEKLKKRRRRIKEKGSLQVSVEAAVEDEISHVHTLKTVSPVRSLSVCQPKKFVRKKEIDTAYDNAPPLVLILSLTNNLLEQYEVSLKETTSTLTGSLEASGHRQGARAIVVSEDGTVLATCAKKCVKLWNIQTRSCIRTIPSAHGLCAFLAPGGKHLVIGTKCGKLQLFDASASLLLEEKQAHKGPLWSLALRPDGKRFASGGADHEVKLWDFSLIQDDSYSKSALRLGCELESTLLMSDDVLCVKYSPDARFLAVALLDCTIKIFFQDTLKFFTSLYGHKLPVTKFDISADSTLLVSASADKNIKLWGLDFGDCHKSIFAHADTVTDVTFVHNTHYFFTTSKDKLVKYWDGDTFDHILTLSGHQSEVWCVSASKYGHFVVTSSSDRSFRLWERTPDIVYLDIQRELDREKHMDAAIVEDQLALEETNEGVYEAVGVGKPSRTTMHASERIIDAIEVCDKEVEAEREFAELCRAAMKKGEIPPAKRLRDPLLSMHKCKTPAEYLLHVVKSVRASDLDEALLVMPFAFTLRFLHYIEEWAEAGKDVELTARCLFYLLKLHHNRLVSSQVMAGALDNLRLKLRSQLEQLKDTIGCNQAGLAFLKNLLIERDIKFFDSAELQFKEKYKRKKRKLLL